MIIVNILVRFVNTLFSIVGSIIEIVLLAFPTSPFNITFPLEVTEILGKANYFIPVNEMIVIAESWLVAVVCIMLTLFMLVGLKQYSRKGIK